MAGMSNWDAIGRIRDVVPRPQAMAQNFLNRRIRNVIDSRTWSDLIRMGMIVIPQQYTTGTVSLSSGSNQVAGVGTNWPVNDAVNTALATQITDSPGYVEIQPSSMLGINQGMYLLLDQETPASTEVISVQKVKGNRFVAYCQYPHAVSISLQASSLAGRQFGAGNYVPTVQAVTSPTTLRVDMAYGGVAQVGISYQIYVLYVKPTPAGSTTPSSTARRMLHAFDAIAGNPIGTDKTWDYIMLGDPQLQDTGDPLELVSTPPDPGGTMQWTLWPIQTGPYAIGVIFQDGWPPLVQPNDLLPPFINEEIFIAGAIADCCRSRVIANERQKDPLYDLAAAKYWDDEYKGLLETATQSDQGRWMTSLSDYRTRMAAFAPNYNWLRAHAVSASEW